MLTAVVTGATSGIGRAIALALADAGYDVLGLGRRADGLEALRGRGLRTHQVDLADRAAAAAAVAGLCPDVLVNNAGVMPPPGNFCDMQQADIDHALEVNVSSVIAMTRALAPAMCRRGSGHIFFTGSTAGHSPFPNLAVYCATKAAIGGFAQALRLDVAASGLRVTEIVAGRVETDLYNAVLPQAVRDGMYAGNGAVQPKDVAAMVLATLALPPYVDVSRFDILPTQQATATGGTRKEA